MCQWRRSLKVFYEVSRVMDLAEDRHPDFVPLFLTLTLKNCEGDKLSQTLDQIFQGWYRLTNHRKIKRIVQGWFRALEVTYSRELDTFHPHIHAIILVDKSYFAGSDYMETTEWVRMWRTALKLDYDPICDIRKVKHTKGKHKAVAEVAKYTMKDSEFITADTEKTDRLVGIISPALKNRRLYAFGGILKILAKELKVDDSDNGELTDLDKKKMREDISYILENYRWDFGVANYMRDTHSQSL